MDYDVVIIGAGLSGMMASALLSRKGKRVLLLEQHKTVGGLAAGFRRKGYYFDSAMHCFMSESTAGLYETLGIFKKLNFRPHRTTINLEGNVLHATNADELTQELCRIFPDEREGILRFYDEKVKKFAEFIEGMTHIGNPTYYDGFKAFKKYIEMLSFVFRVGFGTLSKISKSNGVFVNNLLKDYISERSKAYTYFSNKISDITYKGNFEMSNYSGNWVWPFMNKYPYNGMQGMSDEFSKVVTDSGGEIITGAKVSRIIIRNGCVAGVTYEKNGKEYDVNTLKVISAIDLKKTLLRLVGQVHIGTEFAEKLESQEMSGAVPILYLGVNVDRERVRQYFGGNEEIYYVPEIKMPDDSLDNRDFYKNTSIRMSASCLINPEHAPENKTNLQIYLPCPYAGWLGNWGTKDGHITDEYRKIKEMIIEQVIEVVEGIIPELKDRSVIEVCELGTPFTYERYTGNSEGSHCGFTWERNKCEITGDRLGRFFNSYKGIEGLHFVGHQTGYLGGVTNALWSAKNIAKKF